MCVSYDRGPNQSETRATLIKFVLYGMIFDSTVLEGKVDIG